MAGVRGWMGGLLLRLPPPIRQLRNVPIVGCWAHRLSHILWPKDDKVWAQVQSGLASGIWLELNPRTGQNYLLGGGETALQTELAEKLRPGSVFYDLGANIGLFSLMAALMVGESGSVYSFEPDREVAGRLRRNIARNGFGNLRVIERGVWSETRNVNFVAADASSPDRGTGRLADDAAEGSPVACIALDDFVRDAPPPDVIKCDVEGAELEVFRGATKLLHTYRPWIVYETHSAEKADSVRKFLSQWGYISTALDSNHFSARFQKAVETVPRG